MKFIKNFIKDFKWAYKVLSNNWLPYEMVGSTIGEKAGRFYFNINPPYWIKENR